MGRNRIFMLGLNIQSLFSFEDTVALMSGTELLQFYLVVRDVRVDYRALEEL